MNSMNDAQQLAHAADMVWSWVTLFAPRLAAALAITIAGFLAVDWLARLLRQVLAGVRYMDTTLKPVLVSIVRYTALILVVIAALSQLGIQTTSLLAVVGAAGLAIGLALQGTLSNIAAGIMLLWLRPFHIGDFIEVAGQSGEIKEIGLFVCHLRTYDGLFLFLPNSTIWNTPLKNYTRNGGRLVSVNIAVAASADLERTRQTLLDVAAGTPGTLKHPPPATFVDSVNDGAMVLNLAVWTIPQGAGTVERAIIESAKRGLEALGDGFAPKQIQRVAPPDNDPSRYLIGREPNYF
jgi:small conductance mechanosensitive channel